MGLSLKLDHPHFPDGYEMAVGALGELKNRGEALLLTVEHEMRYIAEFGKTVEEGFGNLAHITISGTSELTDEAKKALMPVAPPAPPVEVSETTAPPVVAAPDAPTLAAVPAPPTQAGEVDE